MTLTYAQQLVALTRLGELGHGRALDSFAKNGGYGDDYDSNPRYGTYRLDDPLRPAEEAVRLFALLGFVVTPYVPTGPSDWRYDPSELHFDITLPTLPQEDA